MVFLNKDSFALIFVLFLVLLKVFNRQLVEVLFSFHSFVHICRCLAEAERRYKDRIDQLVANHLQTFNQHEHSSNVNEEFDVVEHCLSPFD